MPCIVPAGGSLRTRQLCDKRVAALYGHFFGKREPSPAWCGNHSRDSWTLLGGESRRAVFIADSPIPLDCVGVRKWRQEGPVTRFSGLAGSNNPSSNSALDFLNGLCPPYSANKLPAWRESALAQYVFRGKAALPVSSGAEAVDSSDPAFSAPLVYQITTGYPPIALAVSENTLLACVPISRMVPTTMTRMTASITAYSAMS
jgi:hypothetical protein